ncbi:hypothetical protein AB4520_15025 [Vibrio renipiscarius]|uniref:hypothetical protein n=1 Tax=Vibrio renipiscarius TaxID=1461322 RepID=UPI00354DDB41
MKKWVLFVALLCSPSILYAAQQVLKKSAIDALVTPTLLLGQGRYAQAADSFHQQSTMVLTLERKLGAKAMWQAAGLSEGLAAIAAEKNRDAIAYEYWANSVRYFLMSGSSWDQVQKTLHQEFEQSSTRLQVGISPGDAGVSLDSSWLQLFTLVEVWEDKLGYFSYRSPSSDLALEAEKSATLGDNSSSNGAQLRQYAPKKSLQLNEAFKDKQGFTPGAVDVTDVGSIPVRGSAFTVDTSVNASNEEKKEGKPAVSTINGSTTNEKVVATPLSEPAAFIEQEHSGHSTQTKQAEVEPKSEEKWISRGIAGTESGQAVEAVQRRGFAPAEEE